MSKGKIDFNRQIGLYPKEVSKEEYSRTIRHIKLFFEGQKRKILAELRSEMMSLAKKEKFEEAEVIKKRIFALEHIQDVSLIKSENRVYRDENNVRVEAYDVAHLSGDNMVGAMTVSEGGLVSKSEYRKFKIESLAKANDTAALKEILLRRLAHKEWPLPQLIVVDGSVAQKNVAERVLKAKKLVIPVVGVVKDEKHNPVRIIGLKNIIERHKDEILLTNAEAHRFAIAFHRTKRKLV